MKNSDSTSPERALFCREEEDGGGPDIYCAFQGRVALPAAPMNGFQGAAGGIIPPKNIAHFQGRLMPPAAPGNQIFRGGWCRHLPLKIRFPGAAGAISRPWKCALFSGVAGGTSRPWKTISRGGAAGNATRP